ncbi:MAG: hypothetical protein PHV77_00520 [Candidatus Omnitrophica bacterium]|jgi:hypothetical protein|nr:hypothetical protein [Candidatus Omnitrophota bacterium]
MPYKLSDTQIRELVSQPETGMGYQYVEASMSNLSTSQGVVLNSEVFIPEERIEKIMGRRFLTYSAILNEAERPGYIRTLKVVGRSRLQLGETRHFAKSAGVPACQAASSLTGKDQVFKRFSPYRNDRRIGEDGSLLPGAYATTEADARNVRTGSDAMNRYALPSDEPAIYVFTIQPPEKTSVRVGVVEPANGKPGGGVEVLFENGSPKKTVTGPNTIPAN